MRMPWLNRFILTTCLAVSGCQSAHTAEVCENFPVILESFDSPESPNVLALTQDPNYALGDDTDNNYLVATFIGNHVGSERNTRHLDLPPLDSATLSFDVWFEPGFDFVRGGKLPGFAPDTPAWGGETVEPAEWSNRILSNLLNGQTVSCGARAESSLPIAIIKICRINGVRTVRPFLIDLFL